MLHIVVCIKQVPDSREIRIDPKTNTLVRQGVPAIINPYDLNGVEEALRLREQYGGQITVLTMGPPSAEKALKQCIALGADEAVLVSDRAFAGADTLATSYVLAEAIRTIGTLWGEPDIVLCGKQTLDGDTGQVGPGIACRLDYEQLTYVQSIEAFYPEQREIVVHRHLEDGVERVRARLPVLLTVLSELNKPRRADLPGVLRAHRYHPLVWSTSDFPSLDRSKIGLRGSPTVVSRTWVPQPRTVNTKWLDSGPADVAQELAAELWKVVQAESLG